MAKYFSGLSLKLLLFTAFVAVMPCCFGPVPNSADVIKQEADMLQAGLYACILEGKDEEEVQKCRAKLVALRLCQEHGFPEESLREVEDGIELNEDALVQYAAEFILGDPTAGTLDAALKCLSPNSLNQSLHGIYDYYYGPAVTFEQLGGAVTAGRVDYSKLQQQLGSDVEFVDRVSCLDKYSGLKRLIWKDVPQEDVLNIRRRPRALLLASDAVPVTVRKQEALRLLNEDILNVWKGFAAYELIAKLSEAAKQEIGDESIGIDKFCSNLPEKLNAALCDVRNDAQNADASRCLTKKQNFDQLFDAPLFTQELAKKNAYFKSFKLDPSIKPFNPEKQIIVEPQEAPSEIDDSDLWEPRIAVDEEAPAPLDTTEKQPKPSVTALSGEKTQPPAPIVDGDPEVPLVPVTDSDKPNPPQPDTNGEQTQPPVPNTNLNGTLNPGTGPEIDPLKVAPRITPPSRNPWWSHWSLKVGGVAVALTLAGTGAWWLVKSGKFAGFVNRIKAWRGKPRATKFVK